MDDLEALERDLEQAAERMPEEARKVVSKGALNIKNDWRDAWDDIEHAPNIPRTIDYDLSPPGGDIITADIGPSGTKRVGGGPVRTPGDLGGILEFGTPTSAPIPGGAPALAKESPRFEDALGDVAERLLSGG